MLLILPAAPELATLVQAYWFVEDVPGEHAGRLIRTSPIPMGVLSINIGRPNSAESGELVPDVSLLGLQSRSRVWRSCPDTYFVMAMLTIPGLVRLFPNTGSGSANMLLDLGAVTGDGPAQTLKSCVSAEREPRRIASLLDRWLISKLRTASPVPEGKQVVIAHQALRHGATVETAAEICQINRRQLHRLFHRHFGVGPKELADLERLHFSLKAAQSGCGDSMKGFSDQAHQIRSWQRRLGVTPRTYARAARMPLAENFGTENGSSAIAYYL